MHKSLIIGLAASALLCGAANAGDMTGAFGNTIECRYTDGKVTKVQVEAGGHYSIVRPDGSTAKGTWADDGTNVCYTDTDPAPPASMKPVCSPSQARKVGDTWDVTDPDGRPLHGRFDGRAPLIFRHPAAAVQIAAVAAKFAGISSTSSVARDLLRRGHAA